MLEQSETSPDLESSPPLTKVINFFDREVSVRDHQLLSERVVNFYIKIAIAKHPDTPLDFLHTLIRDEDEEIRAAAASSPKLSAKVLDELLNDNSSQVKWAVLDNSSVASDTLILYLERSRENKRRCGREMDTRIAIRQLRQREQTAIFGIAIAITCQKSLETNSLINTYKILNITLSRQHPNITPKLLQILDFFSGSPHTEPNLLFELSERNLSREKALAHPNMSGDVLHKLSFVEDVVIKNKVATHPKTTEFTLNKILQEDPTIVCCHVAIRPDLSEEFAIKLSQSDNQKLLQALLLNPQISSSVLEALIDRLAQDISCSVRSEIAQNRVIPREILEQLSCDRCLNVRLAIAKNPQTPFAVLRNLLYDRSHYVSEIAMNNINSSKA